MQRNHQLLRQKLLLWLKICYKRNITWSKALYPNSNHFILLLYKSVPLIFTKWRNKHVKHTHVDTQMGIFLIELTFQVIFSHTCQIFRSNLCFPLLKLFFKGDFETTYAVFQPLLFITACMHESTIDSFCNFYCKPSQNSVGKFTIITTLYEC